MRVTMTNLRDAVDAVNHKHQGGIALRCREHDGLDGYMAVDEHEIQLCPRYRRKGEIMAWFHGYETGLAQREPR